MNQAFAVLVPFVKAFIIEAEKSGASGSEKRIAVENAMRAVWSALQSQFKELRPYSFEDYLPYLGIVTTGLVSLFNSLFGKLWGFLGDFVIDPLEGLTGIDIDRDGDVDGEVESFDLKPVNE